MTRRTLLVLLAVVSLAAAAPTAACADPGDLVTSLTVEMLDSAGDPETRAGVHPDKYVIDIGFDPTAGNVKNLTIDLPLGMAGDPTAVPHCPRQSLSVFRATFCPGASAVGAGLFDPGNGFPVTSQIFNVDPDPGNVGEVGFNVFFAAGRFFMKSLPNGQARLEGYDLPQDGALVNMRIEMWGVPADHQLAPVAPRRSYLSTPTHCDGMPLTTDVHVNSWETPDVTQTSSAQTAPLVGCEDLELHAGLDFALSSGTTDSATSGQAIVTVPQDDDPDGERAAGVKDVKIRFPNGVALSPGAANDLTACPREAVGLGQLGPTACADSSKIGSAELSSPVLYDAVRGALYLGTQRSANDYGLYVVMRGEGIDLKLAGNLHADPVTGQVTTDIFDAPELPFDRLTLNLDGGGQARPLVTPLGCVSGAVSVALTSHSGGPPVSSTAFVAPPADAHGRLCPFGLPFAPTFVAGTSRTVAGAAAPLTVTIRRPSGDQLLDRFAMTLPPGMSAKIGSVPRCGSTGAGAGTCPPGSRLGAVTVEAGSGDSVFGLTGDIFLTGPYRRAPFGMALVFRAIAGPFDLGTIVTRAAMRLDPMTGQVTIETDPLPRIAGGIPLRIQTIGFDVDRPGFMINPTSCAPSQAAATIESDAGMVSRSKSRFAVGGCRALRFRPKLTLALTDRSELRVEGHPGMRLKLGFPPRGANLRDLSFDLPKLIEPSVTGPTAICSRAQLEDHGCPAASRVGTALGRTPILSKPLKGAVYMTQPPGNGVAEVWAILRGMGVDVRFRMKTVLKDGQVTGKLVGLPDIPLSSLVLAFDSGDQGMFVAGRAPCVRGRARRMLAKSRLGAHNGATRKATLRIAAPGC